MDSKIKMWGIGVVVVLVIAIGGYFWWQQANAPSPLDGFAQCLKTKGMIFYGAFWCPHCQAQKKIFGNAQRYLPYTECSTPNSKGTLPVCNEAKIQVYPTWKLADGTMQEGEMTLRELAEKSGCELPQ